MANIIDDIIYAPIIKGEYGLFCLKNMMWSACNNKRCNILRQDAPFTYDDANRIKDSIKEKVDYEIRVIDDHYEDDMKLLFNGVHH